LPPRVIVSAESSIVSRFVVSLKAMGLSSLMAFKIFLFDFDFQQ